jgi:hypothetical protein
MQQLRTQFDTPLNIALDYDETFTAHRELWRQFVYLAKSLNVKITFVTYRIGGNAYGNEDILEDARSLGIPVVFSNGEPKSSVFKADIWIDDQPVTIPNYESMLAMLQLGEIE